MRHFGEMLWTRAACSVQNSSNPSRIPMIFCSRRHTLTQNSRMINKARTITTPRYDFPVPGGPRVGSFNASLERYNTSIFSVHIRIYRIVLDIIQSLSYLFQYLANYLVKSRLNHSLLTLLLLTVSRVLASNAWGSSSRQWNCAVALDLMSLPAGCRSTPPNSAFKSYWIRIIETSRTCLKRQRKWSAPTSLQQIKNLSGTLLCQRFIAADLNDGLQPARFHKTFYLGVAEHARRIQVKMLQLQRAKDPSVQV